jgi:hypothetical protein
MNDINRFKLGEDYFYLNNNKAIRKGKIFGIKLEEWGAYSKVCISIKDDEGIENIINEKDLYNNMQELFNSLAREYNSHCNRNQIINPPSLLF